MLLLLLIIHLNEWMTQFYRKFLFDDIQIWKITKTTQDQTSSDRDMRDTLSVSVTNESSREIYVQKLLIFLFIFHSLVQNQVQLTRNVV